MVARPLLPRPHAAMKRLIGLLIATTLVTGSGCAKQDWIDRTLVTVDVTGTWSGEIAGIARDVTFHLEQKGSTVKGFISGGISGSIAGGSDVGTIGGTVAGDVFRFGSARADVKGELTVSGEDMSGTISRAGMGGPRQVSLRRVDPSSPQASPPR